MSAAPQFVGRWKTIPVTMCVNHPDVRARARGLCGCCYVKEFYANDEGYRTRSKARAKEWHRQNPERVRAIQLRKRENECPIKKKNSMLKRKYGITIEQFDLMLAGQGGNCAICRMPPTAGKPLHVDHCHSTGRVRGLLCHQCNWYLGKVDSDPGLIGRMQQYLESSNA